MSKFKFNAIFGLQPGIDPDETYQEWREEHVFYAKNLALPDVKKYNINRVIHRFEGVEIEDIWGIAEFWFDDMESAQRAVGRIQGAQPDEFLVRFTKTCKMVIAEEENIKL